MRDNVFDKYQFVSGDAHAAFDSRIFGKWMQKLLPTESAKVMIAANNYWQEIPTNIEFERLANGLGYVRNSDVRWL